jgi:hypothetical protein
LIEGNLSPPFVKISQSSLQDKTHGKMKTGLEVESAVQKIIMLVNARIARYGITKIYLDA